MNNIHATLSWTLNDSHLTPSIAAEIIEKVSNPMKSIQSRLPYIQYLLFFCSNIDIYIGIINNQNKTQSRWYHSKLLILTMMLMYRLWTESVINAQAWMGRIYFWWMIWTFLHCFIYIIVLNIYYLNYVVCIYICNIAVFALITIQ